MRVAGFWLLCLLLSLFGQVEASGTGEVTYYAPMQFPCPLSDPNCAEVKFVMNSDGTANTWETRIVFPDTTNYYFWDIREVREIQEVPWEKVVLVKNQGIYFSNSWSVYREALSGSVIPPLINPSIIYNEERLVKGSWHSTIPTFARYIPVKDNYPSWQIIWYFLISGGVNQDYSYAPVYKTTTYYTTGVTANSVPLVLKDNGMSLDLTGIQKKHTTTLTNYITGTGEIKLLSWEKVLFVQGGGVFFEKDDSVFRTALGNLVSAPADLVYDFDNRVAGSRVNAPSTVSKYAEVRNSNSELIWYFLLTSDGNYLYAPLYKTTPFFTTNGTTLKTVLSGENTLRFTGTKEILAQQLPSIVNLEDKSLVQAFLTTGTLAGSQLHTLEGEKILFFDLGTGTLVLMSGSSIFQWAFTGGIAGTPSYDLSTLKPTWISLGSVVAYNEVRKNWNLVGYALKNQSNQRFYAAKRIVYSVSGWGSAWIVAKPVINTSTGDKQEEKKEEKKPEQSQEELPEQMKKVYSWEVDIPNCSIQYSQFASEQNDAYLWACQHDITTMRTIQEARLDQPLTRAELAKIMSVYAMKEYHLKPLKAGAVNYKDVNADLGDLADYIQLAYQLQIMGINADGTPIQAFEPHKLVSRAEFATVLSRVIWGNKHNIAGDDRYSAHLQALKKYEIITSDVPANWWELRGRALLMLHRTAKSSVEIKN